MNISPQFPPRLRTAALSLLLLSSVIAAPARIYSVTDTADSTRVSSLRGAILEANRKGGDNTVVLGVPNVFPRFTVPQTYHLTAPTVNTSCLPLALQAPLDLEVTRGNLTITGYGSNVTIDATGLGDRIFHVLAPAHLTLNNLTLTGGIAPSGRWVTQSPLLFPIPTAGEGGGAISNAGTLVMNNCVIAGNASGAGIIRWFGFSGSTGGDGGGIYNSGNLTMNGCALVGNAAGSGAAGASGGNGGGLCNDGICRLSACLIDENQAGAGATEVNGGNGGNGGGLFNAGTMVLTNCAVSTNAAAPGGAGGYWVYESEDDGDGEFVVEPIGMPAGSGGNGGNGGGIFNQGQLRLFSCTINNNSAGPGGDGNVGDQPNTAEEAGGSGGGIFNSGGLSVNTCTVSANSCGNGGNANGFWNWTPGGTGGNGGGIYNGGTVELVSATIVLNAAANGGNGGSSGEDDSTSAPYGGRGGNGGGIWNGGTATNVVLRNTLIAENLSGLAGEDGTNGGPALPPIDNNGAGPDLAGNFSSQGFNLVGMADDSSGLVNGLSADQVGSIAAPIDPLFGPLQMNGGPTPTHALYFGSPAVDQGNSFGIHFDQRGHHRPYNYPTVPNLTGGDGSDIGAFELDIPLGKPLAVSVR